jgi:hypothetical protein
LALPFYCTNALSATLRLDLLHPAQLDISSGLAGLLVGTKWEAM